MTEKTGVEDGKDETASDGLFNKILKSAYKVFRTGDKPFRRGFVACLVAIALLAGAGGISLVGKHPNYVAVVWKKLAPRLSPTTPAEAHVPPDAFPKPMNLRLFDKVDGVQIRELKIHGTRLLHGTYVNQWNKNTGQLAGFLANGVLELAYVEDPDPNGQARHGVGAVAFKRVPSNDAHAPQVWVGHSEGCDCAGKTTTEVSAILYEEAEAPADVTRITDKDKTIILGFTSADAIFEAREKAAQQKH